MSYDQLCNQFVSVEEQHDWKFTVIGYVPPDEILAIGGVYGMTLEDLNMQEIRSKYITAMKESSEKDSRAKFNFAPHHSRVYGVGRSLHRSTVLQVEDFSAELVLALAQ